MDKRWYVYMHRREDTNEIFYVGIGCRDRFYRAKSKHNRNKFWHNITSKTNWHHTIVAKNLSFSDACSMEVKLINEYRRRCDGGTLCNLTLGGEGTNGYSHTVSSATRKRIGDAHRGKVVTEETREKLRKVRVGTQLSESTKNKIRLANSGDRHPNFNKIIPSDVRAKISMANTGRKQSNETRRKKSEAIRKLDMSRRSTQSKEVDIYTYDTGEYVGRFHSLSAASRSLGLPSNSNLRLAASGKRNRKQAYGYKIVYVNHGDSND